MVGGSHRDQKHSVQRAEETERLAFLGTTAAILAHEVSNPLTGISTSLQLVERELKREQIDGPSLISIVGDALREVDRLRLLLNEFRSLARAQTLDLKLTDPLQAIEEVLALEKIAYQAVGITLKFEFENALPPVMLDAAKMKQAILNLCKNAVEAMPGGGTLTFRGYHSGPMVVLEISDSGVGAPEGVNIFELFKTTKPGGSGLGLPLVQQIVSAHNGTINYMSEASHGTTFKICLPVANRVLSGPSISQEDHDPGSQPEKEIRLTLTVGNKVVYPCQGPCLIGSVVDKVVDGRSTNFYHLTVLDDSGGELFIPLDKARALGIRELLKRSEIPKLLGHLQKAAGTAKNWKQRTIDNLKLLASGSAFDLAEVIESLTQLSETRRLSPRDQQTLDRARKILICEISEVMGETKSAAEEQVDKALKARKRE
jgi:RNA polymerase-interacting CarD/CdnL/TRCF family regulator